MTGLMRYGALGTKARALFGKRLRLPDFAHMACLRSEEEVLDYLRQQPGWTAAAARFDSGRGGCVDRTELEDALWDQIGQEYQSLLHFAPRRDRDLLLFPVLLVEHRTILERLRQLKAGGVQTVSAPRPILRHSDLDQKALAASGNYVQLMAAARRTIYYPALQRLRPVREGDFPDYAAAEMLLQSAYFSHMFRLIDRRYRGQTQKVLLRTYGEQIDLLNLNHILRFKTYFPEERDILWALFPFHYRLTPAFLHDVCAAPDAAAALALIRTCPYAGSFEDAGRDELEDYYRTAFYLFSRRQLVTGPPCVYTAVAYLHVKELELRALITLIESVKYGVPYDDSFARVIGT